MSTLNHQFDLPEQICYVQCGFCTTILLVSVPCSSLSMVATVRCGHCTTLLSVNMLKASFIPLHLLASLAHDLPKEVCNQHADGWKPSEYSASTGNTFSDNEEEDIIPVNPIINKPPEKRQRAPSAYNRFIKEEIRRLKAENPNMAHKEAFKTAAKNWAHFPPVHHCKGNDRESRSLQGEEEKTTWPDSDITGGEKEGKHFPERDESSRHSIVA